MRDRHVDDALGAYISHERWASRTARLASVMPMSGKACRCHDDDSVYAAQTVIATTTGTGSWQTNATQTLIHVNQ